MLFNFFNTSKCICSCIKRSDRGCWNIKSLWLLVYIINLSSLSKSCYQMQLAAILEQCNSAISCYSFVIIINAESSHTSTSCNICNCFAIPFFFYMRLFIVQWKKYQEHKNWTFFPQFKRASLTTFYYFFNKRKISIFKVLLCFSSISWGHIYWSFYFILLSSQKPP